MAIHVDTCEPKEYRDAVRAVLGDITEERLGVGDYAWSSPDGKRVALERKTLPDLLKSFTDGRWQSQIPRLLEVEVPILLIEGQWPGRGGPIWVDGRASTWTLEDVEQRLDVVQLSGVHRLHVPHGPQPVARRVKDLVESTTTGDLSTLLPRPRAFVVGPREVVGMQMLACLPGVKQQVARKLLTRYGSVAGVIEAIAEGRDPEVWGSNLPEWQRLICHSVS